MTKSPSLSRSCVTPTRMDGNMTFKEAKKEADRIGGVVTWWWSYSVHPASEYSYATCGHPKYHSKGAIKFFKDRHKKSKKT